MHELPIASDVQDIFLRDRNQISLGRLGGIKRGSAALGFDGSSASLLSATDLLALAHRATRTQTFC
jgi:hypothetical protein